MITRATGVLISQLASKSLYYYIIIHIHADVKSITVARRVQSVNQEKMLFITLALLALSASAYETTYEGYVFYWTLFVQYSQALE